MKLLPAATAIFERFFCAEESDHGLGFARKFASAHGGDVALVLSEGGWSEFAVTPPKKGAH